MALRGRSDAALGICDPWRPIRAMQHPLRTRPDAAPSWESGGCCRSVREGAEIEPELREGYYALGVALKQQAAAARTPRARCPARPTLYTCAPRMPSSGVNRSPASNSPKHSVSTRNMRTRTTCWVHSRAAEISPLPSGTSSVRSRCGWAPGPQPRRQWYSGSKDSAVAELRRASARSGRRSQPGLSRISAGQGWSRRRGQPQHAIALLPPLPFMSTWASPFFAPARSGRGWDNSAGLNLSSSHRRRPTGRAPCPAFARRWPRASSGNEALDARRQAGVEKRITCWAFSVAGAPTAAKSRRSSMKPFAAADFASPQSSRPRADPGG
jgi:hypothetical protein